MSFLSPGNALALLSFYSTRAAQITAAQRQVTAQTRGVAAAQAYGFNAARTNQPSNSPRTITLQLLQSAASSQSTQQTQTPGALTTIVSTKTVKPTQLGLLTFDVVPGVDGYAQTATITEMARQSIHNTAVGFYVDEFNMAPGQLSIDVDVLYGSVPGQQVQKFFDMLNQAKLTSPLSNENPTSLRYFDSYLQRQFVITQDSVRCSLDAERQGRARLSIAATILYDYSSPANTSTTGASALTPGQAPSSISNGLLSLGTFDSPNSASVGTTIGA
jgi:hypothetical protein